MGLELTKLNQWARAGVGSCWDGGGAVAVMEKQLGKPVTGTAMAASGAAAAGAASDEGELGKCEMEARTRAGGS